MKTEIILGSLFGDEGKGTVVQWRVREAIKRGEKPYVMRFSGGPQSAHNIISENGIRHTCSTFGAGVFYGVDTVYVGGYFDPICFVNECKELERKGVEIPNVYLGSWIPFITPYDVIANLMDKVEFEHGSCGKGINKTKIRYGTKLNRNYFSENYLEEARVFHQLPKLENVEKMYFDAINSDYMKNHCKVESIVMNRNYDICIIEGTQGMLLDEVCGFYPHTTPSKTGLNGISSTFLNGATVFFTMRAYLTRHGNGYTPKIPSNFKNEYEVNVYNDCQGEFKQGYFEFDLLRRSFDRHRVDTYIREFGLKPNIVMTCCDCVSPSNWQNVGYDWDYNKLDILFKNSELEEFIDDNWGFYYSDNPNSIFHNGNSTLVE